MLWRLFLDVQAVVSYLGVGILMYWLALRLQPDIRGGDGNFAIILLWPVVMPFCLIFFGLPALDRLCRVIERKSEPVPGAPEPEPEKTAEELRREADEDLAAALAGRKHVEVRRTCPNRVVLPVKVLVYCTKATTPDDELRRTYGDHGALNGKVIGEFICDEIKQYWPETPDFDELARESLVPLSDLYAYIGPRSLLHGWRIKDFKLYDTPHPLSDYTVDGVTRIERAPQSWCYVRRKEDNNEDHD